MGRLRIWRSLESVTDWAIGICTMATDLVLEMTIIYTHVLKHGGLGVRSLLNRP